MLRPRRVLAPQHLDNLVRRYCILAKSDDPWAHQCASDVGVLLRELIAQDVADVRATCERYGATIYLNTRLGDSAT